MNRAMWRVMVDGWAMAHGPDTGDDHPERMAETYREINPRRVRVWVERRAAGSDNWERSQA